MGLPDDDADTVADQSGAASRQAALLAAAELPEVTYFNRALHIAEEDGLGLARAAVERVEAVWSIDDGDWTSLGLVLSLRDGSRVHLEYFFDFAEDEEEIELQPMGRERYPASESGEVNWSDDVHHLNRVLMS